mgnify:CR=1 FL=1
MSNIDDIMQSAENKCSASGVRLTDKRKKILGLMLESEIPLSPYEVVDRYNAAFNVKMPANSAYRILDFLVSENLAHKLSSANKYVACSHIACSHQHDIPQFLICHNCSRVKEIMLDRKLVDEISNTVNSAVDRRRRSAKEIKCCASKYTD